MAKVFVIKVTRNGLNVSFQKVKVYTIDKNWHLSKVYQAPVVTLSVKTDKNVRNRALLITRRTRVRIVRPLIVS